MGLAAVELLHIEKLVMQHSLPMSEQREIRFHLAPISYLRSESNFVHFGGTSDSQELFVVDLPGLGATSFVAEWAMVYHRDAEIPSATAIGGFSAVVSLTAGIPIDADRMVAEFRSSLDILSVLFRQAVSLHGWTYTDGETVSTWVNPLDPNVTPSARADRGDFVANPQVFTECASKLVNAYRSADDETRSLVRHLSVAVNPHNKSRINDHFLFMFSALERVVESVYKRDKSPRSPVATDNAIATLLSELKESVIAGGGENAPEIAKRLTGFIKTVMNGTSVRDKFDALFRVHPAMTAYCADLWPILGSDTQRGLREIRHALSHGRGSFVSQDVMVVAEWHLAILLERLIFVLLNLTIPEGISPNSFLLREGGRGWYQRERWVPLRSKQDQTI